MFTQHSTLYQTYYIMAYKNTLFFSADFGGEIPSQLQKPLLVRSKAGQGADRHQGSAAPPHTTLTDATPVRSVF